MTDDQISEEIPFIEVACNPSHLPNVENREQSDHSTDDILLCERKLSDKEKVLCSTNSNIYVKFHKSGSKRSYDVVHSCIYCGQLKTNIQCHIMKKHRHKETVVEISKLQSQLNSAKSKGEISDIKKEISVKQDLLRYQGDFKHNNRVLKEEHGEIILARRFDSNQSFNLTAFGPCIYCLGWLKMDTNVKRHQVNCSGRRPMMDVLSKWTLIRKAEILLGRTTVDNSKKMYSKVFPSMNQDELTKVAQGDNLIVALGEDWYLKSDNKLRKREYASSHMRLMARCLMRMRTLAKSKGYTHMETANLDEFIDTEYFDLIAEAALQCSAQNDYVDEPEDIVSPSVANKIGADIVKVAGTKLCYAYKSHNQGLIDRTFHFLKMYELRWFIQVRNLTRISALNKKKTVVLPSPSDIEKITSYVKTTLSGMTLTEAGLFKETAMLVQSRLVLYNKRRPGEIEGIR